MQEIKSRQNPTVKKLRALSKDREARRQYGEFVCDGEKLLYEAISENVEITTILTSESFVARLPDVPGADLYVAPADLLESVTTLKSAQDVIFSCRIKQASPKSISRAIMLDRLQDTGNIGTIIRTADAFGIDAVFCDGTADVYNPKTIRSAMGSVFRVPIIQADFEKLIPELRSKGKKIYCSELYGNVISLSECDITDAFVVIGNEGKGVRPEISALCDGSIIIPMTGAAESLNASVAAAIFMYEMSGQND